MEYEYQGRTYLPGDRIETGGVEGILHCRGIFYHLPEGARIYRLGSSGRWELSASCAPGGWQEEQQMECQIPWGQGRWQWLRWEVRDRDGKFLAYINPVYRGRRTTSWKTFGDAVRGWKGIEEMSD